MPQRYYTALSLVLFIFINNVLLAQAPQLSKPDTIVAVPLANIGLETEKTQSSIREIRSKINPTNKELEVDSIMPIKLDEIEKLKKSIDLEELQNLTLRQTESEKNSFVQIRAQLEEWRKLYIDKSEEINTLKSDLNDLKTLWELTQNLEREEPLPAQVSERIATNLENVNNLINDLNDRNNALLTKQDELTGALIYIDEVMNVIAKTENSLKLQIYTIDSPPIWHLLESEKDSIPFRTKVINIIDEHNSNFKSFTKNYEYNIYAHLGLFVILVILLFYAKNDVNKWSDEKRDSAIAYSMYILSRPIQSALLVSLLLTRLFYPEAPEDVFDYYLVFIVIPILTILPGLIPSLDKKYFYFIGGIFVLFQLGDYFSDIVFVDRLLLFINSLVTLVIIIFLIKSRKSIIEKDPTLKWGFVFAILKISAFLLVVSLLSNIIGNTVLAKIISQGTLAMIYGGTLIYTAALVLKSLLSLLIQHETISKLNMIQNYPDEVKHHIFRTIRIVAVLFWLYITLSGFMLYEPFYLWLENIFTKEWQPWDGSVVISLGSILAFFVTLWIALTLSKFIRFILQDEILTHFDMPRGVPGAISMIVRLVLITLGFILAFGAAKIDMSNIAIIFGALGVGIGFGLQNIFNNLVSGLILAFERPIQTGDIIQISNLNLMGEVKEIGIRASTVRTFDGAEVVVPNGNLISNEMINWTLSDHRRRQEIIVGVAYGTDTKKVLEILNEVVPEQENVLKNPPPLIIFIGFGESSLDFRVLFWTHFDNGLGTKSRVGTAIDEAFKKSGVEIPFPQRDLHLRSVDDNIDFSKESKPTKKPATRKTSTPAKKESK